MELNFLFYCFAFFAVLLAAISKGGFGSGVAFASVPILSLVMPPELAIGFMLPLLMVMDIISLKLYWKKWEWFYARSLLVGAIPGVFLGLVLLSFLSSPILKILIGGFALVYVINQFASAVIKSSSVVGKSLVTLKKWSFVLLKSGFFFGFFAGFASFVSHAGGPPVAIYLLANSLSKLGYQATTVLVFWWINVLKIFPYFHLGMLNKEVIWLNLIFVPVAIIGVKLGEIFNRNMSSSLFFSISYILLALAGIKLLFDGSQSI